MFLRQVDLTTALRPCLLPEETLLSVYDSIGLYRDRFKLDGYQNGLVYLTSHRIIYVDNVDARKFSTSIHLKDVDHPELSAGFLRSSPKVTLYPKPLKVQSLALRSAASGHDYGSPTSGQSSPTKPRDAHAVWICPICSFSNVVPTGFDPATANANTPLPVCSTCGIRPPRVHLVKAAIAALSQQSLPGPDASSSQLHSGTRGASICPRCTFKNHTSLRTCEMCGSALPGSRNLDMQARADSPGPTTAGNAIPETGTEVIKLSFRAGGEKAMYEKLKNALIQRKWLLEDAPPIPVLEASGTATSTDPTIFARSSTPKKVGIAGLEDRGFDARKTNERVIGVAFDDLEALMMSAKEVIAMAERFAAQSQGSPVDDTNTSMLLSESASALGLVATKDMLGSNAAAKNDSLYLTQLSRDLAEYLTDDKRGLLRREGGIMSLVDLWAVFNRSRNGIELVSPQDFEKAAQLWEQLNLPIRLRRFKSGLLVVQGSDRTDDKTIASLLTWLESFRYEIAYPADSRGPATHDWQTFGCGVTAQDTATRFNWSVGVATEELEMAEEKGVVVREQGAEGIMFWLNFLTIPAGGAQ